MSHVALNIVRRFLSKDVLSDDRFRPPRAIVNAVDEGRLDPHVLLFWKDCVEKISATSAGWKGSGSYSAAVAYWRNKCAKNGYPLPREYLKGLGGEGSAGRWSVKPGDEIEEWVRQTMVSQGLIDGMVKTAAEWEVEIIHLKRLVADAAARVEKHEVALAKAKGPAGIAQKSMWLKSAKKDLEGFGAELSDAKEKLRALNDAAAKKAQAEVYAIEFEKEFQFLMLVAQKDLDKKVVLDSVKKAIERFEAGLEIPDAESPAHDIGHYEGPSGKTAGVLDFITGALSKAWEYLRGAFDYFTDWIFSLTASTKKIDALLTEAGAT